jgi:hypothetical protein
MSSTTSVNFSLRQNKIIERSLVFSGMSSVFRALDLRDAVYIGFGSVWFADFELAHRELGIDEMISLEMDAVVAARANFNKPYRTVSVRNESSHIELPKLVTETGLLNRPWVVWLDYDSQLTEDCMDDLLLLLKKSPPNSFVVTTFGTSGYGNDVEFPKALRVLFPAATPTIPAPGPGVVQPPRSRILAQGVLDSLGKWASTYSRSGGFLPCFNIPYADNTKMVTVGGFLPSKTDRPTVESLVKSSSWPGFVPHPIQMPPLTEKEVMALFSMLPSVPGSPLSRAQVVGAGFDLEDEHIRSFSDYYLRFPRFAQISR